MSWHVCRSPPGAESGVRCSGHPVLTVRAWPLHLQLEDVRAAASRAHPAEHGVHLTIDTPGNMSTWYWRHNEPPKAGAIKLEIAYGEGMGTPSISYSTMHAVMVTSILFSTGGLLTAQRWCACRVRQLQVSASKTRLGCSCTAPGAAAPPRVLPCSVHVRACLCC